MRICYLLSAFILLLTNPIFAQDDCCTAEVIQNNDPITIASSDGNGMFENLGTCSCLSGNEHDSYWFTFEAQTSGTFEMMITPTGLNADFDFGLYGNECPCGLTTAVVSCDYTGPITAPGPFVPTGISSTPMATFGVPGATEWRPTVSLVAGTTYYLIADNITNNGSGFMIEFAGTATIGPPPNVGGVPLGNISGSTLTCPGANEAYAVDPVLGIDTYNWTLDGLPANVTTQGDASVTIDWPLEGTYQLCVSGQAGCVVTDETCITVDVNPIPEGNMSDSECIGVDYLAPDGNLYSAPGFYTMTFPSYQGCDSIVYLDLEANFTSLNDIDVEICPGSCYTLNGVDYCETGFWEIIYPGANYLGCDSTDALNVFVPTYFADYAPNPAPSIDCENDVVFLDGTPSFVGDNPTYQWQDSDGVIVSNNQTLMTFVGGDFTLTVFSETGGEICEVSTTVTIFENSDEPDISADGGDIDCSNLSVTLSGNSNTPDVTYEWTGPSGFSSNDPNPSVNEIGTYTLVVSTDSGCTAEATAEVGGDTTEPDVTADGGDIDCINFMTTLSGSSNTPGVTYEWSGPGGFSSFDPNPDVDQEGTYTLVVTALNGCTAEATADVIGDSSVPDVSAQGSILDCSGADATLTGNSTTPNVTYSWSGPGGFTSNDQNPDVPEVGFYTLIVTGLNGCTAEQEVEVEADMDLPDASATGGSVDCLNSDVMLNGNSATANVTYSWTGPNGFTSNNQSPMVSEPGDYVLTVESANGCTASANAVVADDSDTPDVTVSGTDIDCMMPNATLSGNSTVAGVTYAWTGPNGFSSADQFPNVNEEGDYTLVITAPNGCTAMELVSIAADQDTPDISADGGALDCNNMNLALSGNSTTMGATYAWTGPNGFTSTDASPMVAEMGDYILVVTAPNGCTSEQMTQVTSDFSEPNISSGGGIIDCNNMMIAISGSSTTPDVTYAWTGPNGFTSTDASPMVNDGGAYDLTITGTNGCTSTASVMVDEDTTEPDVSAAGGMVDCDDPTLALQGNSMTSGVTYAWTGPNGFTANTPNPDASDAGNYTLVVTATNGCTASATAEIMQNADIPDVSAVGGTIDCNEPMIGLTASSTDPTVTYAWTGPNGFTSDEQNPDAGVSGDYIITVTAANGCTAAAMAVVAEDFVNPDGSAVGGTLTCTANSVMISGSSNTTDVTYAWTGPGGYSSTEQNPEVTESGDYTLTVTSTNGCTVATTIEVLQDANLPEASAVGATIDCNTQQVQIEGSSTSPNVTYEWSGPNGFTSTDLMPMVTDPGQYVLTVTAPGDCVTTATALVSEDIDAPVVDVPVTTLTCLAQQTTLETMSMDSIVNYVWTGPNGFTSSEANPMVTEEGIYDLVITGSNGCDNTQQFTVNADMDIPDISTNGGILTCNDMEVALSGSSTTTDVTYAWTGPNGFTSAEENPIVTEQGEYILTITATNGCEISESAMVDEDMAQPDIQAIGGNIDCANTMVNLEGSSTDGIGFAWTGPNGFTSDQANPEVVAGGDYNLVVTGANGCTSEMMATVVSDMAEPNIMATGGELTCLMNEINLEGNSTTTDVTYAWTGPNGFTSNDQMPLINEAGNYTLIVTGQNSCTSTMDVAVSADMDLPDVSAIGGILDCADPNVDLAGSSNTAGVTYSWEGPGGVIYNEQNPQVTVSGDYTLTVLAPNGCSATAMAIVDQDADVPDASAIGGTLDCNDTEIGISGNSMTADVTYEWFGPNGFTSINQNPIINEAGNYSVIVTSINGCTAEAIAVVDADLTEPDATAAGDEITCANPTATLSAISTTPDATYLWIGPGGFTSMEQNVDVTEAGNYGLIVTGPNGCTASVSNVMITQDADVPVASVSDETIDCIITEVELTATSNQTDVTYEWVGPGGFTSTLENPTVSTPGTYTLTITAQNDCSASASALVVQDVDLPVISIADAEEFNCTTEEVSIDANNSSFGNNFTITWTTADGNILTGGNSLNPTVDEAGMYVLEILNTENGCVSSQSIEITASTDVPSDAEIALFDPSCFGDTDGQIFVESVIGGTPPYTYSLNGSPFGGVNQFNFLSGGSYDLIIQDGVGCEYETSLNLTEPNELAVNLTTSGGSNEINLGDEVNLNAQVSVPELDLAAIIWSNTEGFAENCDSCLNPLVVPTFTTNYTITVIDEHGCTATDDIQLVVDRQRPFYVPNVFSPNNDGQNDLLMPFAGASVAKVKSFVIFNRWGETIYQAVNFDPNDVQFGWDGYYRGKLMDVGVFIYYAEVEFIDGETELFKGDFSLLK